MDDICDVKDIFPLYLSSIFRTPQTPRHNFLISGMENSFLGVFIFRIATFLLDDDVLSLVPFLKSLKMSNGVTSSGVQKLIEM